MFPGKLAATTGLTLFTLARVPYSLLCSGRCQPRALCCVACAALTRRGGPCEQGTTLMAAVSGVQLRRLLQRAAGLPLLHGGAPEPGAAVPNLRVRLAVASPPPSPRAELALSVPSPKTPRT